METCKHCGAYVPQECTGILEYREDPFMQDVHGEIVMKWLCPGQYLELCWEI